MSENKKPALAVGQKWRTKGGDICIVTAKSSTLSGAFFNVDLNNLRYCSDGKPWMLEASFHLANYELTELIGVVATLFTPGTQNSASALHTPTSVTDETIKSWAAKTRGHKTTTEADILFAKEAAEWGRMAGVSQERDRCIAVCEALKKPDDAMLSATGPSYNRALGAAQEGIRSDMDPWVNTPKQIKRKALEALNELTAPPAFAEPIEEERLAELRRRIQAGLDLVPTIK